MMKQWEDGATARLKAVRKVEVDRKEAHQDLMKLLVVSRPHECRRIFPPMVCPRCKSWRRSVEDLQWMCPNLRSTDGEADRGERGRDRGVCAIFAIGKVSNNSAPWHRS